MISYKEALDSAMKFDGGFDYCTEYAGADVFSKMDDFSIGGNGPVVVMKDNGDCVNMTAFIDEGTGDVVKEGYISEF